MAGILEDLARLITRAFFPPICHVVVDGLIRMKHTSDDRLAAKIKLPPKEVRLTLSKLREYHIVQNEVRKVYHRFDRPRKVNYKRKQKTISTIQRTFWFIDYKELIDFTKYRLYLMRQKISAELEQQIDGGMYMCPSAWCQKKFTTLEALELMNMQTQLFYCNKCGAELQEDNPDEGVDETSNAKEKFMSQLRSITELLKQTEGLIIQRRVAPPAHVRMTQEELAADHISRSGIASGDASISDQVFFGPTGTSVKVVIDKGDRSRMDAPAGSQRTQAGDGTLQLPPWMVYKQSGAEAGTSGARATGSGRGAGAAGAQSTAAAAGGGGGSASSSQGVDMEAYKAAMLAQIQKQLEQKRKRTSGATSSTTTTTTTTTTAEEEEPKSEPMEAVPHTDTGAGVGVGAEAEVQMAVVDMDVDPFNGRQFVDPYADGGMYANDAMNEEEDDEEAEEEEEEEEDTVMVKVGSREVPLSHITESDVQAMSAAEHKEYERLYNARLKEYEDMA